MTLSSEVSILRLIWLMFTYLEYCQLSPLLSAGDFGCTALVLVHEVLSLEAMEKRTDGDILFLQAERDSYSPEL